MALHRIGENLSSVFKGDLQSTFGQKVPIKIEDRWTKGNLNLIKTNGTKNGTGQIGEHVIR